MNSLKTGIPTIPTRLVMAVMMGLACIIHAIIRSSMSITILAMTKNPYDPSEELPDYGTRYQWSTYEQSLVIGSYFWGNTVSCSIGGVIAGRYGARNILGLAFAIAAILSTVSPVCAQHLWLTIFNRFLIGVVMGITFPSIHALIANWAPQDEKGKFLSVFNLTGIGAVIDWSMSGHIIEQYGWMYAFYVVAAIFGIFIVIWFSVVHDSPSEHPRITVEEKNFILSKLTSMVGKKPWPPFRSIFSSIPFWALLCFHFGDMCGFYFLLTSVPRYLSEVHEFSITSTGLLASIPNLAIFPASIVFALIGDFLLKKKKLNANALTKWFSLCSHFIPGCALLSITFVGDQPYTCVAFITIALCFNSAVVVTKLHNAHDIAPNFAASIYGLISIVGSTAGYLSPLVVAYFTAERSTEEEWRKLFYVGAGMFIGSNIIFVFFGSGYVQKWNNIPEKNKNSNV